jgi:outer membrane protein TolC
MYARSKLWRTGLIILLAMFCFYAQGYAATIKVAIVRDGDSQQESLLIEKLRSELEKLSTDYDDVLIAEDLQFSGQNDKASLEKAIKEAFASKKANAVLCTGPLGSHILSKQKKFPRPAFAAQVLNSSAQQIVFAKDSQSKSNLNLIDFNLDLNVILDSLQQIRRVEKLAVIVSQNWISILPELSSSLIESATNLGLKAVLIEAEKIGPSHEALDGCDAAIVFPLSEPEQIRVAAGLNGAGIVSMSLLGARAVENGLFACVFPDIDSVKLSRRLALNLQRLLFNEDPAQYESNYGLPQRLHLNMKTARTVRVYPTWAQMTDAVLYFAEPEDVERKLSLTEVIQAAVVRNLQLAAKQQEIEAGRHGVDRARANLRPKVSLFARENVLDEDRASTIMTPAKYTTQIGADLMQVIYNEPARANIDIQKLMLAAKRDEERALILDIMRDAALAYLNVLKTKTLQAIQRDNLEVTRANLDIARFREEVGTSGPAEVYRWEIQMASARQAVIDASVMRKKAELALNQILNSTQEEEFTTADCDIFAKVFMLDTQKVAPYIDNVFGFKVFRDFLVEHTFARSPEIMQIEKNIEAQKRALLSARRRYNQPTVAVQGNFTRTLKESGPGEPKPAMPPAFSSFFSYPDKNDWFIGLNVSIPLHEGGDRPAAVKQTQAIIRQLDNNHQLLLQRLELNTRITLEDTRSSFASIGLSNTRSEYAAKALDLVQSAYQRGAVNILDLIDAQNASLVSREASANAMFNFFSDFVRVCRAVGSFDFILKQETHSDWQEKLQNYYRENAADAVVDRKPASIQPVISKPISEETNLYREN